MQKTRDIMYENELYVYILHRTLSNDVTTMFPRVIFSHIIYTRKMCSYKKVLANYNVDKFPLQLNRNTFELMSMFVKYVCAVA